MDAVQFGRWLSQRRRACGWQSQRTLVDAARHDPLLIGSGISEDFLARLEAGHLAHPFRNSVRKRVLALAWLLCKNPRDVRTYLRAAEINELNVEEAEQVRRLSDYLAALESPTPLLLPLRPTRLVGRSSELQKLLRILSAGEDNVCAITGMPGSGKSALAYEAVHMLACDERERLRLFPDGIATFTSRGRRGMSGLISLLSGITTVFLSLSASASSFRHTPYGPQGRDDPRADTSAVGAIHRPLPRVVSEFTDVDLACAIDRVRTALADKRVLILLDDLEADFPLRQALDALMVEGQVGIAGAGNGDSAHERHMVLITSSYIPAPALVSSRLHLTPLKPESALELLANLVGRAALETEREHVERICKAVGYLPLAIEAVATAVMARGIPFSLLAARMDEYPGGRGSLSLLDGDHEIHARLERTLRALGPGLQEQYALLATLGAQSFGLETAAAMHVQAWGALAIEPPSPGREGIDTRSASSAEGPYASPIEMPVLPEHAMTLAGDVVASCDTVNLALAQLAHTAADLGQLVRSSLLEIAPDATACHASFPRYQLHPLLRAFAVERLDDVEPEIISEAQRNLQDYALAYIERYQADVQRLESERDFLLAALEQVWRQTQYGQVIRFVSGLSRILGRLNSYEEGERLLLCGIHACRYAGDRYHQARFLNRLGVLLCYHGELTRAQYVFKESLLIAEELVRPDNLWHPLCNLAHIAHILGEYSSARRFAETYVQRMEQVDDPNGLAVALFKRGFYARLQGDMENARKDLTASMQLFSLRNFSQLHPFERISEMEARTEYARVQGDYVRAQQYMEETLTLVQEMCDRYGIADLLFDQACFAHQQGLLEEARQLASRVIEVAKQIGADHFYKRSMSLLHSISG